MNRSSTLRVFNKTPVIVIAFILFFNNCWTQVHTKSSKSSENLTEFSLIDIKPITKSQDKRHSWFILSTGDSLIFYHGMRENEYFQPKDTLDRDYVSLSGRNYFSDALAGMRVSQEYTGSYDCFYLYEILYEGNHYLILPFYDANYYGSFSTTNIVVFKLDKQNIWQIQSFYESTTEEYSEEELKYTFKNEKLILISAYIKEFKNRQFDD